MILTIGFILFANYQRTRLDNYRRDLSVQQKQSELIRELINNISHDFRTPLSTIYTSTYLLQHLEEPEKRHKAIHRIEQQASRLEWMVKNLLTISKLDSQTPSNFLQVDIKSLLQTVTSELTTTAKANHITIDSQVDIPYPYIYGDAELLNIMLVHVIENAINYSPQDTIITVKLNQVDDECLQITVIDDGVGIAESDLEHIFDRFYRADKSRSMDTGGNGLGLSIVKQVVDLHHGNIAVTSQLGEGTTVTIALPIYQHNAL